MGSRKTGVPAMMLVARRLCALITRFTPIILSVYPTATALHVALDTANAACAVLYAELDTVREYGD
jgi:hypothetical protein